MDTVFEIEWIQSKHQIYLIMECFILIILRDSGSDSLK